MKTNLQWVALVAVAILALGAYFFHASNAPKAGGLSSSDITSSNYTQVSASNGIFITGGGLTNTNGFQSNGGVITAVVRQALVSGTSTPCAIADPLAGTSTLVSFQLNQTVATSSAITWAIGTSTTAFSTSTTIGTPTVVANATTNQSFVGGSGAVLAAGNFVVAGSGAGTTAATGAFGTGILLTGFCQATFQSSN